MANLKRVIIMRYEIPVIGTYEIDEGMVCLLNNKEFAYPENIMDAKEVIRSSVADQQKTKIVELQSQMSLINEINVGLMDEKYRIEAYKN